VKYVRRRDTMTKEAHENRNAIEGIRQRLNVGAITYDEAKAEAQPTIDRMNEVAYQIADDFGTTHTPFTFSSLMH